MSVLTRAGPPPPARRRVERTNSTRPCEHCANTCVSTRGISGQFADLCSHEKSLTCRDYVLGTNEWCVCCDITSLTRIAYGSLVRRQGSGRALSRNHARSSASTTRSLGERPARPPAGLRQSTAMPALAVETPIGRLGLVGSERGLSRVRWSAAGLELGGGCAVLDEAAAQLGSYFAGDLTEFDLPLDLHGTDSSGSAGSRSRPSRTARPSATASRRAASASGRRRRALSALRRAEPAAARASMPSRDRRGRLADGLWRRLRLKRFLLEHEGALLPLG